MMNKDALLAAARKARHMAYAPYSGFSVGAAVLCEDGRIFTGCNVENASYSATVCAERVAALSAVAAGARRLLAVAVVGGHGGAEEPCTPCGVCRQVLSEFAGGDMPILFVGEGGVMEASLSDLLPAGFSLKKS